MHICTDNPFFLFQFMFPNHGCNFNFFFEFPVTLSKRKFENEKYLPPETTKKSTGCTVVPGMDSLNVMHKISCLFYALTGEIKTLDPSKGVHCCTGGRVKAHMEGQVPG